MIHTRKLAKKCAGAQKSEHFNRNFTNMEVKLKHFIGPLHNPVNGAVIMSQKIS